MLLPQVEHAYLAGRLAEAWNAGDFCSLSAREELIAAVYHHDDGWPPWDAAPGIDPVHRRPWAFDEMPLDRSTALWSDSIAHCAGLGNLAEYVAAQHFLELLSRSQTADRATGSVREAIDVFRRRQEGLSARCAARWIAAEPSRRWPEHLLAALRWLQFFDALSLWICTVKRSEATTLATPDGSRWLVQSCPGVLTVTPWPFVLDTVSWNIPCVAVPAGPYDSPQSLLASAAKTTYSCRFVRGDGVPGGTLRGH